MLRTFQMTLVVSVTSHIICRTLHDKLCLSHGMCLFQVMMTLHFLNDVTNDAESAQNKRNVKIASLKSEKWIN